MNNIISLKNISKNYHDIKKETKAIQNISFDVNDGEIVSIVGPSGCGKSTLLSIISLLDKDYNGNYLKKENLKMAYMLQSDALLPFLTIYENAILGLKIKHKLNDKNKEYVNNLLKFYKLYDFKNNYPSSLSGGMKQRVALIRTLALSPDLLLLDEPFSALDSVTRLIIENDVYKALKKEKKAAILVTHNIEEAITFSDKVIVLSKRPSQIKKIIDINISSNDSIYERKKDIHFNDYFDEIWKELDIDE